MIRGSRSQGFRGSSERKACRSLRRLTDRSEIIIIFIGGYLEKLKGFQKQYLRGIAHGLKPYVFVGQKGITESLLKSVDEALDRHELIKVRFIDFKERDMKKEITAEIEKAAVCELVGAIGHVAIFFRQQKDPEKRAVIVPNEKKGSSARLKNLNK
ncbi:MAG: YhbY family RNA-binding protein [Proteobacteria bacterium]|nr:YhbY family RNA-binding protein [Pseudomonadota bacterium]